MMGTIEAMNLGVYSMELTIEVLSFVDIEGCMITKYIIFSFRRKTELKKDKLC